MNDIVTLVDSQRDADLFIEAPRLFVIGRPSLSPNIDDFYAYFGSKQFQNDDSDQSAEKIVENAGRVCYLSFSNPSGRSTAGYIENLISQGHESVLEHAAWTLVLAGVSRSFTHQLVRHRVGFSFSQLSQQYVDHRSIRFVIPPEMLGNAQLLYEWKKAVLAQRKQYVRLLDRLDHVASTMTAKEQLRSKRSAARSVLPNSIEATIAITANARAWRHFLDVRGSTAGDIEMRRVCALLLSTLRKESPSMFFDFAEEILADGWPLVKKCLELRFDAAGRCAR
jgi:thymidylate synthase (FAD)